MTTAADPHEEFEIAALRRARGALDAEGVARLDAHLATCAACRGFEETATATEAALRERTRAASGGPGRDAIRVALQRISRDRLTKDIRDAAGLIALTLVCWWTFGRWFALFAVVSGVVSFAIRAVRKLDRERTLRRADAGELLAIYRKDLDSEIGRMRRMTLYGPLLFGICGVNFVRTACIAVSRIACGRPIDDSRGVIAQMLIMLLAVTLLLPLWRRSRNSLPAFERERRELGL